MDKVGMLWLYLVCIEYSGSRPELWRNVTCWRPSAPTAPLFGAPPTLKVER